MKSYKSTKKLHKNNKIQFLNQRIPKYGEKFLVKWSD